MKFQEARLVDYWRQNTFESMEDKQKPIADLVKNRSNILSLYDIQMVFFFLCSFLSISLMVFGVEIGMKFFFQKL